MNHFFLSTSASTALTDLDLKVKDWSEIDSERIEDMREEVHVDVIINVAEILVAAVMGFKYWLDRKKIQRVNVAEDKRGGIAISLEAITTEQLNCFVDKLGLPKSKSKKV